MENIEEIIFYNLENTVKTYRQFAQKNTLKAGLDITIDQWLILKTFYENPTITQQQLAKIVFKDIASVTRIIDLLIKKEYLERNLHKQDRRRFEISITKNGLKILKDTYPISVSNRKKALEGITDKDIYFLQNLLQKIILNINQ